MGFPNFCIWKSYVSVILGIWEKFLKEHAHTQTYRSKTMQESQALERAGAHSWGLRGGHATSTLCGLWKGSRPTSLGQPGFPVQSPLFGCYKYLHSSLGKFVLCGREREREVGVDLKIEVGWGKWHIIRFSPLDLLWETGNSLWDLWSNIISSELL